MTYVHQSASVRLTSIDVKGDIASGIERSELFEAFLEYGYDEETTLAMLEDGRAEMQLRANNSAANGMNQGEIEAALISAGLDPTDAALMAAIAIDRGPAVRQHREAHLADINKDRWQEWLVFAVIGLAVVAFLITRF